MAMHASANHALDDPDDCAIFFGLSGTGKTTLSADPKRMLIGDDEHGWGDNGVFNFEGGCYAKVIRLDPAGEPEIYETTRRFGTILEHVSLVPTADPKLQGGRRLDILAGINLFLPGGGFGANRLALEAGLPVYEHLDGPQMSADWSLTANWRSR